MKHVTWKFNIKHYYITESYCIHVSIIYFAVNIRLSYLIAGHHLIFLQALKMVAHDASLIRRIGVWTVLMEHWAHHLCGDCCCKRDLRFAYRSCL